MSLGRNAKRTRERHARNFGAEADAVRGMPCLAATGSYWSSWGDCCGPLDPAHVVARGMGGVNSDRFKIVPLCRRHHEAAGEANTSKREAFEAEHGIDLLAAADQVALGHERPLGIRGLADRCKSGEMADVYEVDALRGWLTRRMAEYVEACTKAGIGPWDASELGHMDDMASWMALDLFDDDDADGQSKARALCEWAGWPS